MIRVLVISPFPAVRAGLRALLEPSGEVEVVEAREPGDGRYLRGQAPDVVLLDDIANANALDTLRKDAPDVGIVLLGGSPAAVGAGAGRGATGYLTRDASAEEILAAIRGVARGLTVVDPARMSEVAQAAIRPHAEPASPTDEKLTQRELEVLQLMAAGLPNKTIALQLGISDHTAKFHVSAVLAKLGAASRTEAVTTAARRGLLLL